MQPNFNTSPAVQSILIELEVQRKKIASTQYKGWIIITIGIILFAIIANIGGIIAGAIIGGAALIYGGITLYKIQEELVSYKNSFKNDVIGSSLREIDPSLAIDPNNGIIEAEFRQSQLFTEEPDRYQTEDLISGKIDKTHFYFAEVHAEYKTEVQTKNGRQITWHDILKGIVFVADFNKNFSGVTVIRPKDFGATLGAWFAKNVYTFGNKNLVELENDLFNKKFIVYGTDQVEARYILTPALMERIGELNQRAAYTISLSFINSTMYIAFPLDNNYFEAPVFKSLLTPNLLADDFSVLKFMYEIIHELDLNTRIWTKQ